MMILKLGIDDSTVTAEGVEYFETTTTGVWLHFPKGVNQGLIDTYASHVETAGETVEVLIEHVEVWGASDE